MSARVSMTFEPRSCWFRNVQTSSLVICCCMSLLSRFGVASLVPRRHRPKRPVVTSPRPAGTFAFMPTDDDRRSLEQEVAAGQSEKTPVALITSVTAVIAVVFVVALLLAVLAYALA